MTFNLLSNIDIWGETREAGRDRALLPGSGSERGHHGGQHVANEDEGVFAGEEDVEAHEGQQEVDREAGYDCKDEHAHHFAGLGQVFDGEDVGHNEEEDAHGGVPETGHPFTCSVSCEVERERERETSSIYPNPTSTTLIPSDPLPTKQRLPAHFDRPSLFLSLHSTNPFPPIPSHPHFIPGDPCF